MNEPTFFVTKQRLGVFIWFPPWCNPSRCSCVSARGSKRLWDALGLNNGYSLLFQPSWPLPGLQIWLRGLINVMWSPRPLENYTFTRQPSSPGHVQHSQPCTPYGNSPENKRISLSQTKNYYSPLPHIVACAVIGYNLTPAAHGHVGRRAACY